MQSTLNGHITVNLTSFCLFLLNMIDQSFSSVLFPPLPSLPPLYVSPYSPTHIYIYTYIYILAPIHSCTAVLHPSNFSLPLLFFHFFSLFSHNQPIQVNSSTDSYCHYQLYRFILLQNIYILMKSTKKNVPSI